MRLDRAPSHPKQATVTTSPNTLDHTVTTAIDKEIASVSRLMAQQDQHYYFFIEAGKIVQQAENLLQAAPNVERSSIEQSLSQLEAIRIALYNFDNRQSTADELQNMIHAVTELMSRLTAIYDDPIDNDILQPETLASGPKGGRPALVIDLEVVLHLWDIGCKWVDIAKALGCSRQTLYNHLKSANITVERKTFTQISNYDLDIRVLAISREHPFIGSTIMKGHLEAQEIHVSLKRVKESLKRVDPEAVLLRYYFYYFIYTMLLLLNAYQMDWNHSTSCVPCTWC
jgi:hypothetical protein